jgi:hypothetical protein
VINIKDGTLAIHGGTVNATVAGSEAYSTAIVVQRHAADGDALIIDGGTLIANGNNGHAIYLSGGSSRIDGGQVTATGAQSGILVRGYDMVTPSTIIPGTLTLGGGTLTATNFDTYSGETIEGTIAVATGMTYTDGTAIYDGSTTTATLAALTDVTLYPCLQLADNADNTTTIAAAGKCRAVILKDRTLYKDGKWNTLCLPFDVTISGSQLDGAGVTARPLSSASISGNTLTMTFGDAVTILQAGTPYIIKWDAAATNIYEPVFTGVTIDATDRSYDNKAADDTRVRFLGTYKSTTFENEDNSILFLGATNTLYYPYPKDGKKPSIGAQRAYFKIGDDNAPARQLTDFNINFGEEEDTQGINAQPILNSQFSILNSAWYDLQGRKLESSIFNSQSSIRKKGLYIHGGRKVVIK